MTMINLYVFQLHKFKNYSLWVQILVYMWVLMYNVFTKYSFHLIPIYLYAQLLKC